MSCLLHWQSDVTAAQLQFCLDTFDLAKCSVDCARDQGYSRV